MPTTLFRFITVRNPRRPRSEEVDERFVRYEGDEQSKLAEAMATGQAPPQDAVRRAGSVTYDQLKREYPVVVGWAEWLAARTGGVTWGEVRRRLRDAPLPEEEANARAVLWDVVVASVLVGGRPEVRESALWALRALNLVRRAAAKKGGDDPVGDLGSATVLMPTPSGDEELLVRHVEEERTRTEFDTGEEASPPKEGGGPMDRLAALEEAHEALSTLLAEERERHRLLAPSDIRLPRVDDGMLRTDGDEEDGARQAPLARWPVLNDEALGRLDDRTRDLLLAVGVGHGVSLSFALDRVEHAARLEGSRIAGDVIGTRSVVQVGGALWMKRTQPVTHIHEPERMARDDVEYEGFHLNRDDEAPCRIKPLGIADFRRVEQELDCYEAGEVAHIENVMEGETKERTTRRLRRTELMFTQQAEEERLEERDTQTTDRFELEREASKVVESDMEFSLGVNVTAQYGPVRIVADARFATSTSTVESDRQASTYAKEVIDRAVERVVRRVREERVTRTVDEYEETNLHRLENESEEHIVGLYRWVDKRYTARVVNYGKRLMFEFLVPEPGAFHLHAMANEPVEGTLRVEKPVDPRSDEATTVFNRPPLRSHSDVTSINYAAWAGAYNAKVDPPPPLVTTVGKAYHREGMDQTIQFADSKNDLQVPEGYEASWFTASYGLHSENQSGGWNWVAIGVGRQGVFRENGGRFSGALSGEDDIVAVTIIGRTRVYTVNVVLECTREALAYQTWQAKTFAAILQAYNDKLAAYETALAEARAKAAGTIQGTNPALNREIEQTELKRGAIRLLTFCRPLASEAMQDEGDCGYPEFDCDQAQRDGTFIQFVEQAFEWELLTYTFYPYFWGRKCQWQEIYRLDDVDPMFLRFLRAGFARVVVPVRPGYERAALRFLSDGVIWNGGDAPGVDSPMYVAIENELREPVGEIDPKVQPWALTVPTSLVALQCESGCVPGAGLPCPGNSP